MPIETVWRVAGNVECRSVRRHMHALDPAVREWLLKTGTEPVGPTPQKLAAIQQQDSDKWAKLVRAENIKAE